MTLNRKIHQVTPVVLCGGSGTRLWPLSRNAFPKQFLTLLGKTTLFQQAVDRLQHLKTPCIKINDLLVVTNEEHRFLVLDQLREIKDVNAKLILEPVARNTAPALTLAALQAIENNEDPILVVTPADHMIQDKIAFSKSIQNAIQVAAEGSIVVLGIKPTKPHTGFGYIYKDNIKGNFEEYKVLNFIEKPDLTSAINYIKSDDYLWNSGIFVLRASLWLKAIKSLSPDIFEITQKAFNKRINDDLFIRPDIELFKNVLSNSIDYAVIEKCPLSIFDIKMVQLDADWNDLGSWDAVWQSGVKDENQNVSHGDTLLVNTKNTLIYSDNKLVCLAGVDNLFVIETSDVIMILDRNHSQHLKEIVDKLQGAKRKEQIFHRKVYRPWGWYDNIDEGDNFKVKHIQVNPGASLSLQKHLKRAEHWIVVKGVAEVICGDAKITLRENESTFIPLGYKHRLSNPGKDILEIIEVQSGKYLDEDDIVRFEDFYGRASSE